MCEIKHEVTKKTTCTLHVHHVLIPMWSSCDFSAKVLRIPQEQVGLVQNPFGEGKNRQKSFRIGWDWSELLQEWDQNSFHDWVLVRIPSWDGGTGTGMVRLPMGAGTVVVQNYFGSRGLWILSREGGTGMGFWGTGENVFRSEKDWLELFCEQVGMDSIPLEDANQRCCKVEMCGPQWTNFPIHRLESIHIMNL